MPTLLLALAAFSALHLLVMAAAGKRFGVAIALVSLGMGPTIFKSGIYRIGALPFGGFVKFRHSSQEVLAFEERDTALDARSATEQIAIALSGCAALLTVAVLALGSSAYPAFAAFPQEIFMGAISPLNGAQTLLDAGAAYLRTAAPWQIAGITAAKLAALNMLPFPATNGGAAIAVLARRLGARRWWPAAATTLLTLAWPALLASWALAFAVHAGTA